MPSKCHCGKMGIYRVNKIAFCSDHRDLASLQLKRTPQLSKKARDLSRAKGTNPFAPIMVPKPKIRTKEDFRTLLKFSPTPAEVKLREVLNESILQGCFQFQVIICGYIPDFVFPASKLIVEADGSVHDTTAAKRNDARRTHHLAKAGYQTIRFDNYDILNDSKHVLACILATHRARLTHDAEGTTNIPQRKKPEGKKKGELADRLRNFIRP